MRLRLVWWFVVVLAIATVGSILVVHLVFVQRLEARIDADLRQEVDEIERLARGNDPETGAPFGSRVDRVFDVFLERNIPGRHEVHLAFVDRQLADSSAGRSAPESVERDAALLARWSSVERPERGRVQTEAGALDYQAVPFLVDGRPRGVFVVGVFHDLELADSQAASVAAAIVGLAVLLIGSLLAVRLADHILKPVRLVTRTAQSISETDLSQRIPVRGHDEISELASTFNAMLDRLDGAFATQRRFVDDAGHELRTPITIIQGHLDLMGDEAQDRQRTLALVDDELRRVERMVGDLLTLARAERPDFLRVRPADLEMVTHLMFDKAVALGDRKWHLDGVASGTAMLDEQRMTQAVLQLVENAVRHTTPGGLVAIGSEARDGTIRFWVRDSGPGVKAEDRERIFERFYRGASGRRRAEGSGLGLSIVQAIAQAHGGQASVGENQRAGAVFTVTIPLHPTSRIATTAS